MFFSQVRRIVLQFAKLGLATRGGLYSSPGSRRVVRNSLVGLVVTVPGPVVSVLSPFFVGSPWRGPCGKEFIFSFLFFLDQTFPSVISTPTGSIAKWRE